VVTWAQRGRAMTSELKGGNQARIKAPESDRMIARAERLLPAEYGQITVRGDSGFYSVVARTHLTSPRGRQWASTPSPNANHPRPTRASHHDAKPRTPRQAVTHRSRSE
jgi:hypothetical protein